MMDARQYHVRIPNIVDVGLAIKIYYETMWLRNKEIRALFGAVGHTTTVKLKNMANDLMRERGLMPWDATSVNTAIAYEAWGLDIADLEKRYSKLLKYGMRKEGAVQA